MRGIPSLITNIRKNVFTEVARMAYAGGGYEKAEDLPYIIVPGDRPLHRESVFLERAIAGERVRLAMGLSIRPIQTRSLMTEGMDRPAIASLRGAFALHRGKRLRMLACLVLWMAVAAGGALALCYGLNLGLNRISPYYLYSEAVSTIMDPSVRTTNLILPQQLSGAISGYLSLGQSILLVWPHMTGLLALTAVMFGCSYIAFMRREVRSR